jgi:hypothetical protein
LPAHLSPFVDNSKEGYIPMRQKEINQFKGVEEDVDAAGLGSSDEEEDKKVDEVKATKNVDEDYTDEEHDEEMEKVKKVKIKKYGLVLTL